LFPVYEVAKATSNTALAAVEPTARFSEIGDWREFAIDGAAGVPTRVERVTSFLRVVFVLETGVDIADKMVIVIVAYDYLFYFAKLAHFAPKILVKAIEVMLQLCWGHLELRVICGVLVEVGKEDGLRVGGFDMFARASITVSASSDLVVERAVDLILLSAKNGGEI